MYPLRYLTWLIGTVLGLSILLCLLSVLVDPYRMYGVSATRWTALKPRIYQQDAIAKTYQLERVHPRTLLIGNSRVEVALDPESSAWPTDAHPIFNAAEAGKGLDTALDMLRDAIAAGPLKTVILGLDFPDFLENETSAAAHPPVNANERRLLVDHDDRANPDRTSQLWRDRLVTTLTIDALSDSLATLVDQNALTSTTMTPLGFNPMHDYRVYVERDGSYGLFAQKDAIYESQYAHYEARDFADPSRIASFRYLESIIREANSHHIQLFMYIHPYHANFLEILHKVGLWPSFEAWKRALVRVVEAEQSDSAPPMRLLDFSGYNEVTTERVPSIGDRQAQMRWYWESGHYNSELGELILSSMFGGNANFGRKLTRSNIDAVLASIRAERERYRYGIEAKSGTE